MDIIREESCESSKTEASTVSAQGITSPPLQRRRMSYFGGFFTNRKRPVAEINETKRRSEREKQMKALFRHVKTPSAEGLDNVLCNEDTELASVDPDGSLLKYAVAHRYEDIVHLLIHKDSPMKSTGDDGLSALHMAVKIGSVHLLNKLLQMKNVNVNMQTLFEKRTPLHMAVRAENLNVIDTLISHGAHVNKPDIYGGTPLHLASRLGAYNVIDKLLKFGADVYGIDNEGWTALHAAAESGETACVRLLLEHNAPIDAQSKFGKTCLHWACENDHLQVIQELLDQNANVDIRDSFNKRAADFAKTPLTANLVKSYSRVTTTKEFSCPKHEFMDYNTEDMSLIDLLDLSQYEAAQTHHLIMGRIGSGAQQDVSSKIDRSISMVYFTLDDDVIDAGPRQRANTMGAELDHKYGESPLTRMKNEQKSIIRYKRGSEDNTHKGHISYTSRYSTTSFMVVDPDAEKEATDSDDSDVNRRDANKAGRQTESKRNLLACKSGSSENDSDDGVFHGHINDAFLSTDSSETSLPVVRTQIEFAKIDPVTSAKNNNDSTQAPVCCGTDQGCKKCAESAHKLEAVHSKVNKIVDTNTRIIGGILKEIEKIKDINHALNSDTLNSALWNIESDVKGVIMNLSSLKQVASDTDC